MQMPLSKQNLRPGMPLPYQIITSDDPISEKLKILEMKSHARNLSVERDDLLKSIDVPDSFNQLINLISDNTPVESIFAFKYSSNFIFCLRDVITSVDHINQLVKIFKENETEQKVKAMYCIIESWDSESFADYVISILKDTMGKFSTKKKK